MDNKINFRTLVDRLDENQLPYGVLPLQNGVKVVVSQRGGRIFGPFLDDESPSLFWINSAFSQPGTFREFLESGHWNLGGERIWIAPEVQYHTRDRFNFFGQDIFQIPAQMDPGRYKLQETVQGGWRLSQELALEAYNLARGRKELSIDRLIQPAADPLRSVKDYAHLVEGVLYAGYEQIVTLQERQQDDIVSETWSLLQLNPGGTLVIPATPMVEFNDYYLPIDNTFQTFHPHYVSLRVTGDRTYKVGYKSPGVFGRIGYFNALDSGRTYLIVRNFFNNPSGAYTEEIDVKVGMNGHSIHVYNDDGGLGGFGELECNAQAIGSYTDRSASTDQLVLWIYTGPTEKIKRIALYLLGVEF